jgi:glucose/arabinose dehydrogenase
MRAAIATCSLALLACGTSSEGTASDAGSELGPDSTMPDAPAEVGQPDAPPEVGQMRDAPAEVGQMPDATADAYADSPADAYADSPGDATADVGKDAPTDAAADSTTDDSGIVHPCQLPGTVQYTASGTTVVDGGAPPPQLAFLHLPAGYCAHYYGNVGNARQIRIAPSGEAFVASPTTGTTGGGPGGQAAIVVLPDDDHDGTAEAPVTFLSGLPSTQGLMFAQGYLYYQDATRVLRVPYTPGQRTGTGPGQVVIDVQVYRSGIHWPKTFDLADDGTIYVGNGGDQSETCVQPMPFHGGILKIDGTSGGARVAMGLRNPIALRCSRGHDLCFALELAMDYSGSAGGREKLLPIRDGDNWGFPCCATTNVPYPGITPVPDCSGIAPEQDAFVIGDTPFGLDFEPGLWPAPYTGSAFVATHGALGSWTGARLVAIAVDPVTGMPGAGSNLPGVDAGAMGDFATGWDDGTHSHGRPAAVTFAADGRLFLANDNDGDVFWIAPMSL